MTDFQISANALYGYSEPVSKTESFETGEKMRVELLEDMKAKVTEAGWDLDDVELTLHLDDQTPLLFEQNKVRFVLEARRRG